MTVELSPIGMKLLIKIIDMLEYILDQWVTVGLANVTEIPNPDCFPAWEVHSHVTPCGEQFLTTVGDVIELSTGLIANILAILGATESMGTTA